MTQRNYTLLDQVCLSFDHALKTLTQQPAHTARVYPAATLPEPLLSEKDKNHAAGLMRVNHAGEVCAQALYHGQALVSRSAALKLKLEHAALEEGDHLMWCQQRLVELGSHVSYLNPGWYMGSFVMGMVAGILGDQWSLGFLAETEKQVVQHLASHLNVLDSLDPKSATILQQMQQDEAEHHDAAIQFGAVTLPTWIKQVMRWSSKVMVTLAYRI